MCQWKYSYFRKRMNEPIKNQKCPLHLLLIVTRWHIKRNTFYYYSPKAETDTCDIQYGQIWHQSCTCRFTPAVRSWHGVTPWPINIHMHLGQTQSSQICHAIVTPYHYYIINLTSTCWIYLSSPCFSISPLLLRFLKEKKRKKKVSGNFTVLTLEYVSGQPSSDKIM